MKISLLALFIFLASTVYPVDNVLHIGWGGIQPRYYYPNNDLEWNGLGIILPELGMDAGIRSMGTFYFFSVTSYDIHAMVQYRFHKTVSGQWSWENSVLAGGGYFIYLRREAAGYGGFYPSIAFRSSFAWNGFSLRADLLTKWYSDGFSIGFVPEAGWAWGWIGIYVRSEPVFTVTYSLKNSEWDWNNSAGVQIRF